MRCKEFLLEAQLTLARSLCPFSAAVQAGQETRQLSKTYISGIRLEILA